VPLFHPGRVMADADHAAVLNRPRLPADRSDRRDQLRERVTRKRLSSKYTRGKRVVIAQ
jgi:hypothetical protein